MDSQASLKLASLIDHTLLKPNASGPDHMALCEQAKVWNFRTVCVYPQFVELCTNELEEFSTEVCAVIDFPGGLGDVERNVDVHRRHDLVQHGAGWWKTLVLGHRCWFE